MSETSPAGEVRLRRPDRSQVTIRMECDDQLIPEGHEARAVWEFSGKLDLSAFSRPIKAREGVCGRDATDPRLLFCLWLFAATEGVGSARELARLCLESAPYKWLTSASSVEPCGGVGVNHHLLADFRVGHGAALDETLTAVLACLAGKGLVTVHRISQDGTRVRA